MRSSRFFLALFFGAVLVHTGAIAWVHHREGRVDAYTFNSLDCGEYYSIARNIVRHGAFSQSDAPPHTADTWRTPGYPMFLAAGMLLVGDSPTALILIQHLAAIGSVLLFFKIASRYLSPGLTAIASVIFLIEPYHLYYSFWLLSTTVFTLVLLLIWWAWERVLEGATARHFVTLGLLSGFLVLIWPGAVFIPLLVVVGFALHVRFPTSGTSIPVGDSRRMKWPVIALVVIACLVPPLAWMTRNKLVAGHFALSHQSGIVLAYFKATEVELWRQGRTEDRYIETSLDPARRSDPHTVWDGIDAKLCKRIAGDGSKCGDLRWPNLAQGNKTSHDSFDSFAISRELSAIGRSMLLDSPMNAITCGLVRVAENLTFPLNLAIKPAEGAPVNRIKAASLGTPYALLVLAAGVGIVRARRQWPTLYFPVVCIIALALTTAPQIDPRFRAPLIPFLAFLAFLPARREEA